MAHTHREQFKPIAPNFISLSTHYRSPSAENQHHNLSEHKSKTLKKCAIWCGCVTAILLLLFVILIVLAFTVYNVKDPEVRMNAVTLINGTFTGTNATNIVTILADMSVKNTNSFTFRYGEVNTTVYYDGTEIGRGLTPPGKAKAQRTERFNVTLEIMAKKVVDKPEWVVDIRDRGLNFSTYTKMSGKVKILNLIKRKVGVELNCTSQYNITTRLITRGDNCVGFVSI